VIAPFALGVGDPDCAGAVDCEGQDEAVVVVGVVAHEVHAAGGDNCPHRSHSDYIAAAPASILVGMGRFQMSWEIAKRSWAVLRADKTLAWFPVLSALGSLVRVRDHRWALPRGRHRRLVDG